MKISKITSLFLLVPISLMIGCGGTNNSEDSTNLNDETNEINKLVGKKVEIFDLNGKKIYSTITYQSNDINRNKIYYDKNQFAAFDVNDLNLSDDDLVLVKVYNDNPDLNNSLLKGAFYSYTYVKDLENNKSNINEFSTLSALLIKDSEIKDKNRINDVLSKIRTLLFKDPNFKLYYFNPDRDLDKLKNPEIFDKILFSNSFENYVDKNTSIFIDSDKDGLFDDFEIMINSNPNEIDSDGDEVNDYGEFFAGNNPNLDDVKENEDILYSYQWHLKNIAQTAGAENGGVEGYDIDVVDIWKFNTGNKKIKIGVVDTGIEATHPDLDTQIDLNNSYRYSDGSNNPSPDENQLSNKPYESAHGTAVAGIIAAKSWNKIGVSGISPSSTLVGLNAFSKNEMSSFVSALSKDVNISSNSWGISSGVITQNSLIDEVIAQKSQEGTIFVFAAGNDRKTNVSINNTQYFYGNANNSSFLNNKYTIVVAAMDANGSYSSYSNFGDNVLVTAPGGEYGYHYPAIVTTDLTTINYGFDSTEFANDYYGGKRFDVEGNKDGNYTNYMNGTSSATPMVSGVISLILNANPNLNYRDVKYILAKTARKIDENNPEWYKNSAGIWFNPNYGFGLVDAKKAVEMAKNFTSLPIEKDTQLYSLDVNESIPDNNSTGINVSIDVDENISIEYVNAWVNIPDHTFLGDLEIDLVSPSGTVSKLSYGGKYYLDGTMLNKRYGSNKFLGEYSKGKWKLIIKDLNPQDTGTLTNFSLKIYGH